MVRYLKGTIDYNIVYERDTREIQTYVDSDWAEDVSNRRSCSGYVTMLAGGPVSWCVKKQKSVALSTMEAEYVALSEAIRELTYVKGQLRFMQFNEYVKDPTIIHCDNQSAILMCRNPMFHNRSKHVDIRYHYSREQVDRGNIEIIHLRSEDMIADIFTKPLSKSKHEDCVKLLNLCNNSLYLIYISVHFIF